MISTQFFISVTVPFPMRFLIPFEDHHTKDSPYYFMFLSLSQA